MAATAYLAASYLHATSRVPPVLTSSPIPLTALCIRCVWAETISARINVRLTRRTLMASSARLTQTSAAASYAHRFVTLMWYRHLTLMTAALSTSARRWGRRRRTTTFNATIIKFSISFVADALQGTPAEICVVDIIKETPSPLAAVTTHIPQVVSAWIPSRATLQLPLLYIPIKLSLLFLGKKNPYGEDCKVTNPMLNCFYSTCISSFIY